MNILLVGGNGKIMDAMIDKLNKGGHRVYLLTGRFLINGYLKDIIFHMMMTISCILWRVLSQISYCLWEHMIQILTGATEGRKVCALHRR